MATVTVVNATAAGNWLIWGGAGNPAGVSSSALNWGPGNVLANTTLLPSGGRTGSGAGGPVLDFAVKYNGPSGQADVIVDVVGYFVENTATALECVYLQAQGTGSIATGSQIIVNMPSCAAGYTKTGVGCNAGISNDARLIQDSPSVSNRCNWVNYGAISLPGSFYTAETVCCRIPGQ